MKVLAVKSLRRCATALHRIASIFNEGAYRLDHAGEGVVVHVSPLAGLLAEVRQSIRDRELHAAKRDQRRLGVVSCKINSEFTEGAPHKGNCHSLADTSPVDTHPLYSAFTQFLDERLKPGTLQPRDVRRAT